MRSIVREKGKSKQQTAPCKANTCKLHVHLVWLAAEQGAVLLTIPSLTTGAFLRDMSCTGNDAVRVACLRASPTKPLHEPSLTSMSHERVGGVG